MRSLMASRSCIAATSPGPSSSATLPAWLAAKLSARSVASSRSASTPADPEPSTRSSRSQAMLSSSGSLTVAIGVGYEPMSDQPTKFLLSESDIPTHWVNLLPDLPGDPLPPLNPGTQEPAGPDDLTPIFPMGLIEQEVSPEPEIEIPEDVREAYN